MRKTFIIISIVFFIIGLVLTFLPMGTIPLLPLLIAGATSIVAFLLSKDKAKFFPKFALLAIVLVSMVVIGKEVLIENKVVVDNKFIQEKQQSKQEAKKDLEDIEHLDSIQ